MKALEFKTTRSAIIRAAIITFLYLAFGFAWILITDTQLFEKYSSQIIDFYSFQIYKGLLFVSLTAVLVYLLSYYALRNQASALAKHLENERHLLALTSHSKVGIYDADTSGHIVYSNDRLLEITGITDPAQLKREWAHAIHPDDREKIVTKRKDAVKTGADYHEEYRYQHANGQVVWVIEDGQPWHDDDGKVLGYIGTLTDITERKNIEIALTDSKNRFRKLVEAMPFAILTVDSEGTIQYANEGMQKLFGYRREDLLGQPVECVIPARFHDMHIRQRNNYQKSPVKREMVSNLELYCLHKDGREIPVEIALVPLKYDGDFRIIAVINDISKRRKAEKVSNMLAERNQKLVTALGEIVYAHNILTDHIEWQGNTSGVLGYTLQEMGTSQEEWLALIHPDDRAAVLEAQEDTEIRNIFDAQYRIMNKEGDYSWFWDRGIKEFDTAGKLISITGVMRDITARKEVERAMEESQFRLEHVLGATPTVLYVLKIKGEKLLPVWVSASITRILGYSLDEAMQPDWWESNVHPEDRDRCLENIQTLLEKDGLTHEYRFMHKNGEVFWIRDELRVIRDRKGQPQEIVGAWNDITERVETESKLRQVQKLDAIGQLTSGIAHDFNNRLTVILGNLQLLEKKLEDNKEAKQMLHAAIEATRAGATLTQRLLSFSKQQVLETDVININDLILDVSNLMGNILEENITIELRLDDGVWQILSDAGQLQEALLNLCVNARDAMPEGGNLIIETSNVTYGDDKYKPAYKVQAGDYVKISVSDSGCGMPREVLDRAFEPFFTTKKRGKSTGTGLGLAMVYGFIKQTKGYVHIYSEQGHGTCVNIYLPRLKGQKAQGNEAMITDKSEADHSAAFAGNITVLVVEDDEFVRNISTLLLKELSCEVIEADNGAEGLQVMQERDDIDLVFSDMMMPGGMNGVEMIEKMREQNPELRAIIVSGYSEDTVVSRDMNIIWLRKPFTRESLISKLNEAFKKS